MVNINEIAHNMGAKSIDKVKYKESCTHVCVSGGNVLYMRTLPLLDLDQNTRYVLCRECGRMFYATSVPEKHSRKKFIVSYV